MKSFLIAVLVSVVVACAPRKPSGDAEAQRASTLSGIEVTFCDEDKLNSCVAHQGGSSCLTQHCNKQNYQDNVCATHQFNTCLANQGGTGCKKFCGHPLQCFRKNAVFDCGPGGCRCLDTGLAASSPLGDTFIDLAASGGLSFASLLLKGTLLSVSKISANLVTNAATRALASSLDDSFGTAFGMGARFGLRMTAHAHELTANGAIKIAPNIIKVKISAVKRTALPKLGTNAENYIWIVDDAGHFIIAPEVQLAARQSLGHPTLCGGCFGRIAGEISETVTENGLKKLVINNQSGRYFNDADHGKAHLMNAAKVLQEMVGPNVEVVVNFLGF